jgi:hypothetical protein
MPRGGIRTQPSALRATVAQPYVRPRDSAKLAARLSALYCATIRLRSFGYAGERSGLSPAQASEIAALADAVHNLPHLAQHWETCDEKLLREMLEDCDRQFPNGRSLLVAYDVEVAGSG